MLQHFPSGIKHLVFLRQRHCIARCSHSRRNNGNCINRLHIRQHVKQNGMAGLMISCNLFLLIRNNFTALLCSDSHLNKGLSNIFLNQISTSIFSRQNSRLIQQVFQLCTCKTSCSLSNLMKIHIVSQRFILGMNLQNLFSSFHIRNSHRHLAIKTSGTQDSRIQDIHAVGSCHNNNAFVDPKAIHLYQQLIQGLFSLIMSTAHTGTSTSCHCINLINKNDTGSVILTILKEVTNPGSAHAHKHFHEIRSGNRKKRNTCFSSHSFSQQCFTGSRRSHQKHTLGNSGSYLSIFLRFLQKIYDFHQIFFFFIKTSHILEGHLLILVCGHLCTTLAKVHHLGIAAASAHGTGHEHHQYKHHDTS